MKRILSRLRRRFSAVAFLLIPMWAVNVLAPVPCSAETLFALVDTGEIFASEDAGQTWTARSALAVRDAIGIMAGDTPEVLWIVTETGSILGSVDAGFAWSSIGTIDASDIVDLAGRSDGAVLAVGRTGTIWVSLDEGTSFDPLGVVTSSDVESLVRGSGGQFYVLTRTGTVWESLDGGVQWTPVGGFPVSDAVALRATSTSLVAMTDAGTLWTSNDQGRSWVAVGTISQVGMSGLVSVANELFAIHRGGAISTSSDGLNWSWIGSVQQVNTVALGSDVPQTTSIDPGPGGGFSTVELRLWPNPIRHTQELKIELAGVESQREGERVGEAWRLELFGTNGRAILSHQVGVEPGTNGVRLPWKFEEHPSGVYWVRATGPGAATASRPLVVLQ